MDTLMIDMDDVIVGGGFLYLVNEFLNANYTEDDIGIFYIQQLVPEERRSEFLKYMIKKGMYTNAKIYENVYEVLEKLNKKYKLYIGTSYLIPELPYESGVLLLEKHNFLLDNFPFLTPNNFAFLNDKSVLNCKIKIDDRLHNLDCAETKILYTAYHNKNMALDSDVQRANNWLEIEKLLIGDEKI